MYNLNNIIELDYFPCGQGLEYAESIPCRLVHLHKK